MKQNEQTKLSFPTRDCGTLTVTKATYGTNEALAVELIDANGEPAAMLSVNIPEDTHRLGPNEFFVKTWSENEQIAADARASGIFRDTGRESDDTLCAPIWAFN
jgi:hypothetical protein